MSEPRTLYLPFRMVDESFSVELLLQETPGIPAGKAWRLREQFDMSSREEAFARQLLRRKRNLWLFRCHQQAYCGDFIVVDMSDPRPARRPAWVLELKARAPLKKGSGAGLQVKNAPEALAELCAQGVLTAEAPIEILLGDEDAILEYLGATGA